MKIARWSLITALLSGLAAFAVACGADPTPTPAPTPTPVPEPTATPAPGVTAMPEPDPTATPTPDPMVAFQAEWDALVAAAKDEGELVFIGAWGDYRPAILHFGETYGINIVEGPASGRQSAERLLAERQRGVFAADAYNRGGGTFARLAEAGTWEAYSNVEELLIHPDALDLSKQRFGKFYWTIPEGYTDANGKSGATGLRWQFQVTEVAPIAYNTTTVSQEMLDSIQSYRDMLRPEIVERTVMDNFFIAASTGRRVRMWRIMGPEFLEQLFTAYSEAGNLLQEGDRGLVDGMAAGKWDMSMASSGSVDDVIDAGLPWAYLVPDERLLEGGLLPDIGGGGARMVGVPTSPANPNATKLFFNWLLTQEGQTAIHTMYDGDFSNPSLRNDVPQGQIRDRVWNSVGMSGGEAEIGQPLAPGLEYQKDLSDSLEFGQQLLTRLGIAF